jgi:hypothetical protein
LLHTKTSSERSNFISTSQWNILRFITAEVAQMHNICARHRASCAVNSHYNKRWLLLLLLGQFVRRASYADLLLLIN